MVSPANRRFSLSNSRSVSYLGEPISVRVVGAFLLHSEMAQLSGRIQSIVSVYVEPLILEVLFPVFAVAEASVSAPRRKGTGNIAILPSSPQAPEAPVPAAI